MNRHIVPFIVAALFIPILILGLNSDPRELPSQYIGKPAPEFDLPKLKSPSQRIGNSDLLGRVSLVNIWATWCGGCRAEHQFLNELSDRSEIPIYGINWRDDREKASRWLSELGDPYVSSGFDASGRTGIDWGAYGAPETFLVDANGRVLYRYTGPLSWSEWNKEFVPLLAKIDSHSTTVYTAD